MEERKLDMENLKTVSDEKEEHSVLEKKIGRTRYHVHLFFDPNSKETMQQKIMRMMKNGKRQILMRSDTKLPQPFASWSNSL